MKNHILLLSILLVLVTAGCGGSPVNLASQGSKPGADHPVLSGLNRELGSSYGASFVVTFEGASHWTYSLNTRKTAALSELSLHIEGITGADNPGDIRLVTDGKTSWVSGQGTDNECMQFPNGQGMDPQWILPESLISLSDLNNFIAYSGEETISSKAAKHFSGQKSAVGAWKTVKVDVWQDKTSQGLLRYTLEGQTADPFFNTGDGKLTARYDAFDLASNAVIQPVKGCEISISLPDGAGKFVRLPGMASFESNLSLQELETFFQQRLAQDGWSEKEVPAIAEDSIVLSYVRGAEEVEIHLVTGTGAGNQVKLIFGKGQ